MRKEISLKRYHPNWFIFYIVSLIIHIGLIILMFLSYPKHLELKVKEIKIKLITQQNIQQRAVEPQQPVRQQSKPLSKKDVDNLVFEIVAPKIAKSPQANIEEKLSPISPTKEILPTERKLSDTRQTSIESGSPTIKETKGESHSKVLSEKDSLDISSIPSSSKRSTSENLSGNIKWIKGGPRKVIEWYSPEIPPNILRKETEIVLIFYIEPSGFVSRVEISKTSGEPLIDEIILKTMRRIRFNPENYSTVASVSLTIIPR